MAIANLHTAYDDGHDNDGPQWARLKAGDPGALGYFYDRYADPLFAMAIRLTKNRELAKDAIQEVFVELWQYRAGIGTVSHSLAYLQKALRNKLFRQIHSALRQAHLAPTDTLLSPDASGEETMILADEEKETRHRLARAFSFLSDRQRLILTLHFYEGLSYEQIAEKLRINYQSVNNLAYRTMIRLRNHMMLLLLLAFLLP